MQQHATSMATIAHESRSPTKERLKSDESAPQHVPSSKYLSVRALSGSQESSPRPALIPPEQQPSDGSLLQQSIDSVEKPSVKETHYCFENADSFRHHGSHGRRDDHADDARATKTNQSAPLKKSATAWNAVSQALGVDDEEYDAETQQFMELIMKEVNFAKTQELEGEMTQDPHWLIDSCAFSVVIGMLILLNTLQMGLEAEFPHHETLWLFCENVFTAAFLIEMALKLGFLGWRVYTSDAANWLDASIVFVSVLDCWLFAAFSADTSNLQSLSILRVVRLVRLVRVLRLVKHLRQLVIVIRGVVDAIRMTFWIACVVFLSVYVGAIVCTEYIGRGTETLYPGYTTLIEEIDEQEVIFNFNPYLTFGSMPKAMLTLFNIALMAEWVEVVRPISLKQPLLMVFFLLFLFFTAFGVMNVMVGMIVDNVYKESSRMDGEEFEKERRRKLLYLGKIRELIYKIDQDKDDIIGVPELSRAFCDDEIGLDLLSLLNRMKIPVGLKAEELLYMLDNDGDGMVHKNEFVRSFFRLIESTEFQQICIVQMGVNHIKSLIRKFHAELHVDVTDVKEEVQALRDQISGSIQPGSVAGLLQEHADKNVQDSPDFERSRDDMLANLIKESQRVVEKKLLDVDSGLQNIAREFQQFRARVPSADTNVFQSSIQTGSLPVVRASEDCPDTAGGRDIVRSTLEAQAFDDAEKLRYLGKSRSQPSLHEAIDVGVYSARYKASSIGQNFSAGCFEAVRRIQSQLSGVSATSDRHQERAFPSSTMTLCEVNIDDSVRLDGQFGVELKFTHPLISNVRADSVARNHGICSGDVILTCNGISTWGMSRDDVVQALKQRPLKLGLERQSFHSISSECQSQRQFVG